MSEQRQLRRNLAKLRHATRLPTQKQKEIPPDPFLRFTVVAELKLVLVEPAIVPGAEDVVKVFVVDDRLDEKGRNLRRIQPRMNSNLRRAVIVGAEADAVTPLANDLMSPSHLERWVLHEIHAMDLGGQGRKMVMAVFRQGQR